MSRCIWCDEEHLSSACLRRQAKTWSDPETRRVHLKQHGDADERRFAMVLLSGGLDSTALVRLAREEYDEVAAVGFGYGQVNRDAELSAAGALCARRAVPFTRLELADAVGGVVPLVAPDVGLAKAGVSRANLPGRNSILISIAAAHAARTWPGERIALLIGATLDDAAGFPDCRRQYVDAMSETVSFAMAGLVRDMTVRAPWIGMRKADVLAWCMLRPAALADVKASVSCYRGTRCGACDACTLRASAFLECGIVDDIVAPSAMHGGDPAREAKFK